MTGRGRKDACEGPSGSVESNGRQPGVDDDVKCPR